MLINYFSKAACLGKVVILMRRMSCSMMSYNCCCCDVVLLRQYFLICHKNYDSTNCSLLGNVAANVTVNVVSHLLGALSRNWPICVGPDTWLDFHCKDSLICGCVCH